MLLEATQKGKKSKQYIRSGLWIELITYHMYTNKLSQSSVSMFKQTFTRCLQKSVNIRQTCDKQKGHKENMWKLSAYIPLKSSEHKSKFCKKITDSIFFNHLSFSFASPSSECCKTSFVSVSWNACSVCWSPSSSCFLSFSVWSVCWSDFSPSFSF